MEFWRESKWRPGRQRSAPAFKGGTNGVGQSDQLKRPTSREEPQVIEVLHAGVGDVQDNHRMQLLGNDRLSRIREDLGRVHAEYGWDGCQRWHGSNRVAESDVDLERYPGGSEFGVQTDSDAFVFSTLANALGLHSVEIEDNAVQGLDHADFANRVGDLR